MKTDYGAGSKFFDGTSAASLKIRKKNGAFTRFTYWFASSGPDNWRRVLFARNSAGDGRTEVYLFIFFFLFRESNFFNYCEKKKIKNNAPPLVTTPRRAVFVTAGTRPALCRAANGRFGQTIRFRSTAPDFSYHVHAYVRRSHADPRPRPSDPQTDLTGILVMRVL